MLDLPQKVKTWRSMGRRGRALRSAWVWLDSGTTRIGSDISQDGEDRFHPGHLEDRIPKTLPFDLALRIDKDGNVPQIQFNDDSVWHDFAPDRAAMKTGPYMVPFHGAERR